MSDINPETPVGGGGARQGANDGVSGEPDGARAPGVNQNRSDGGESEGGAYANPQTGKSSTESGFMGHGGQATIDYYGGGQGGHGDAPNAATGSDSSDGAERGSAAWRAPEFPAHEVHANGQTFAVVETNGVAEAEEFGKVGTAAPHEREQHSPGSG